MRKNGLGSRSTMLLLTIVAGAFPAAAWEVDGHALVARTAVDLLPRRLPAFFRGGGDAVAHAAVDPDLFKLSATPQLRDQESPEHYLNVERLEGSTLPEKRYEFLRLIGRQDLDAGRVGMLPYSVTEGVQRLTIALAEHRDRPGDKVVRAKALYFAGVLAHYAADMCQPLHTTVHYDGRLDPDGQSARSGIHEQVDSLFTRTGVDRRRAVAGVSVTPHRDVFAAVITALEASHSLVDSVYELESQLIWPEDGEPVTAVRQFAVERYRVSATWVASLLLSAWELSEGLDLPRWVEAERRRNRQR